MKIIQTQKPKNENLHSSYIYIVLDMDPWTLYMLGKCSTTEQNLHPLADIFLINKIWTQSKCVWTSEWINNVSLHDIILVSNKNERTNDTCEMCLWIYYANWRNLGSKANLQRLKIYQWLGGRVQEGAYCKGDRTLIWNLHCSGYMTGFTQIHRTIAGHGGTQL
jgi:hypothetical protein